MENKSGTTPERAILVGVASGSVDPATVETHLEELELLAQTAGAEVVGHVIQRMRRINPAFFIGKGKAQQLIQQAHELDCQLLIFDDDLHPGQIKNFQQLSKRVKVIDRSALILDIFRKHARTREAKTQVELAHLQYLLPRLTRMWTHLERQMGGIGTRAGAGETQIEVDRRLIRNRIAHLKRELVRIEKERSTQTARRKTGYRVSLVGYTNAGKSTLMNAITGAEVFIEDQLFATLDTTVRKVVLDNSRELFISDTVGFIRKLPHHLVASFRSTLAEITESDLVIVVADASSDQLEDHLETIRRVLGELQATRENRLLVFNKIDRVTDPDQLQRLKNRYPEAIWVSAKHRLRIDRLLQAIADTMESRYTTARVEVDYADGKTMALVQEGVEVMQRELLEDRLRLTIRGRRERVRKILHQVQSK
ncbi:MAG: GTPase HflX [Candidatus Neomarinimicrobiota bacterium]|nr:MAG: GTPase HflX [Candidatus Neomarinimicrobiota bacterium]